jgi:LmbE family N-acetylglucosaminyl deacetylase
LLGTGAKERLVRGTEGLWSALFAGLGRCFPAGVERASSPGRHQRVLVVSPHPDDEAIGCAGALLLHKRSGATVTIVEVTDGSGSRALGLGPQEMAARRKQEVSASAHLLGVDHLEWLGLPEGHWQGPELLPRLEAVMVRRQPDLVYLPSRIDFHPEHRKVARALAELWSATPPRPEPELRIYPIQVPLFLPLANLVIDVSPVLGPLRSALDAYQTQLDNMPRALRHRRYTARFHGVGTHAEEFCRVTVEEYRRMHALPLEDDARTFRGLRRLPFTDPLAYATGLTHRRRLARDVMRGGREPESPHR